MPYSGGNATILTDGSFLEQEQLLRERDAIDEEGEDDDDDDDETMSTAAAFFQLPVPPGPRTMREQEKAASQEAAPAAAAAAAASAKIKTRFVCGLLALTGVQQAFCFRTYGSFPNMMTGHAIKLMEQLSSGRLGGCLFHSTMIVSYIAGLSFFAHLKHHSLARGGVTMDTDPSLAPAASTSTSSTTKSSSLMTRVSRVAAGFFVLSDLVAWLVGTMALFTSGGSISSISSSNLARLPILAIAFGLINAATMDSVGVVTFAITGQMNKIAVAGTEMFWLQRGPTEGERNNNRNSNAVFETSCKGLAAFFASLLLTNIWMNMVGGSLGGGIPSSSSSHWIKRLGVALAGSYSALFYWYTSALGRSKCREEDERQ